MVHNSFEEEPREIQNFPKKNRLYHVLAYVPFINILLLFFETEETNELQKKFHRQGITLFLLYIVLFLVFWLINTKILIILTTFYIILIIFFSAKAFNGIYVEVKFIESIITMFTKK